MTEVAQPRGSTEPTPKRGLPALALALCLVLFLALSAAGAQAPPDPAKPVLRPELEELSCPPRDRPAPRTEADARVREARARYAAFLPLYFARVPVEPDTSLLVPVEGVQPTDIADTFGAARSGGRGHEGLDIFAPQGTPVLAAAPGFVYQVGGAITNLGGMTVTVVGGAGRRYYYAHLSAYAEGLTEGQYVEAGTLLGYVGASGNAKGTPPHLHFGIYEGQCRWDALDPYPLLTGE